MLVFNDTTKTTILYHTASVKHPLHTETQNSTLQTTSRHSAWLADTCL